MNSSQSLSQEVQKAIEFLTNSFEISEAYEVLKGFKVKELLQIEEHFSCKRNGLNKQQRVENIVNSTVGARRRSHLIRGLDLKK